MNATIRNIGSAVVDRGVEICVVGALTGAAATLTWWFTVPAVLATAWWATVEVRLWRAHRTVPASTGRAILPSAATVSGAAASPAGPVSAGQTGMGRAGA